MEFPWGSTSWLSKCSPHCLLSSVSVHPPSSRGRREVSRGLWWGSCPGSQYSRDGYPAIFLSHRETCYLSRNVWRLYGFFWPDRNYSSLGNYWGHLHVTVFWLSVFCFLFYLILLFLYRNDTKNLTLKKTVGRL